MLDGIDRLPLKAQRKLLGVIDTPNLRACRSADWRPAGVRLVALSQTSPTELLLGGGFLEALLYRLNPVQQRIPSLGERREDLYDVSHLR